MASFSFKSAQAGDSDDLHYNLMEVKKEEQDETSDYDLMEVKKEEQDETSDYDLIMEVKKEEQDETSDSEESIVYVQQRTKRRWTSLEDAMLLGHVAVHGPKMWRNISEQLQERSSNACRVRWVNYLSPAPFSSMEEVDLLMPKKRRGKTVIPSAAGATAAVSPLTAIFTGSDVVSPARSSALSRTTSVGSRNDSPRRSTFKCTACRFNLQTYDADGQRTFMADCGICRRVAQMGGRRVNGETYMVSTGNVHQPPSVNVNLTLATTDYGPQPPSSPPPPPPPPPSPSSPPPPPSPFYDFLGVGSV